MVDITERGAERKSYADQPANRDRDLLLGSLREAATRSRLQTTVFENVGNELRFGRTDCAGARARLKQEGLLHFLREGAR